MKRYGPLVAAALAVSLVGGGMWLLRSSDPRQGPPNVVLVSIDTLRADHLGSYGYRRPTSPSIDALAADAVRFSNAFSQAGWTLPSHMSVMTSQYSSIHGVTNHDRKLPEAATTLAEILSGAGYQTAAFVTWVYVSDRFGFDQGFDEFHELIDRSRLRLAAGGGAYPAERATDKIVSWLGRDRREPFFLFAHYFDPHLDYAPPPPHDTRFDPGYRGRARGKHAWLRPYIKGLREHPAVLSPRDRRYVEALYDGEISYTDGQFERLLEALEASVGLDNCVVVLMSDHGEEFGDHGSMEGHGWTLYDEILHVPLIFRLPGAARAGSLVEAPVELIDIAPTILDAVGIAAPVAFQGSSLLGVIDEPAASSQTALVFAENAHHNIVKRSIRGLRYKLIHTEDTGRNSFGTPIQAGSEFYDLERDPGELINRYDPESPVVRLMEGKLEDFLATTPDAGTTGGEANVQLSPEDIELLRSLGYVP